MASEYDFLGQLDPDDPKQASQQIANKLRAAILTGKLQAGERLPSQPDLASRYGVARETVKRALDVLRTERLVISRQGSGVFVRAQTQRAVELRAHIEAAFEQPHVSLDFAGFSGETLRDAMSEALDKVRIGRHTPESMAVRVLLCDMSGPGPLPAGVENRDDPRVRERAQRITRRAADGILDLVTELADLGLVKSATAEVKLYKAAPLFKLYIVNQSEAFYGFYPVIRRPVSLKGEATEIFDLMGKDVALFHYVASDDDASDGAQFVASAKQWFDSVWNTIAYGYQQ
ncbi:winged helix-turn-helix domain-containing protein [Cryptosporangium sp. NPDC051539]|uniref:winged helix-turn-helix domain-containing protein n=1 Tax=Cryptosporangium sp. NPDC051539 TaxID=3363962 RepID=UPI0037922F88